MPPGEVYANDPVEQVAYCLAAAAKVGCRDNAGAPRPVRRRAAIKALRRDRKRR